MLRRLAAVPALVFGGLLALGVPAWAHVEIDPGEAVAGSTAALTFIVEHGKDEGQSPAPRLALVADPNASSTTTTDADLPGTTLEAEERDDGKTSVAPWVIGSGLAAAAAIGIGGTILKRRAG